VLDYFRQPDKQDLVIKAVESNLKGKNKMARLSRRARDPGDGEGPGRAHGARPRRRRGPQRHDVEELEEFVVQGLESMMASGEISFADVELGDDAVQDVT
jgi:hypothetical protein